MLTCGYCGHGGRDVSDDPLPHSGERTPRCWDSAACDSRMVAAQRACVSCGGSFIPNDEHQRRCSLPDCRRSAKSARNHQRHQRRLATRARYRDQQGGSR